MSLPALTYDASYKFSCVFCGEKHKHQACTILTDIESTKAILCDKNKCFRFLCFGHSAKLCRSNMTSFQCGKHDHVTVCQSKQDSEGNNQQDKDTSSMLGDNKK